MSAEQRLSEVDCLIFVRAMATVWWRKEKAKAFFWVFIDRGILARNPLAVAGKKYG